MIAIKVELVSFFAKEWARPAFAKFLHRRTLLVTHGNFCTQLSSTDGVTVQSVPVSTLECSHEKADTRLLLHAAHAAQNGSMNIVICSPDTDVAVLAVSLLPQRRAGNVFLRTGRLNRLKHIGMQVVRNHLGPAVSGCLIGLHALTGCNSTSAFKRRGKRNAVEVLKKHPAICLGLQQLGMTFEVTDDLLAACETFVRRLYQARSTCTDVNKLRF